MKCLFRFDVILQKFATMVRIFLGMTFFCLVLSTAAGQTNQSAALETRTFHVDPNTFIPPMQVKGTIYSLGGDFSRVARGSSKTTNIMLVDSNESMKAAFQAAARQYISATGVDLSSNLGKSVVFNDRKGAITVKATRQDLDLIESKIVTLNPSGLQVLIKTKFVEITTNQSGKPPHWNELVGQEIMDAFARYSLTTEPPGTGRTGTNAAVSTRMVQSANAIGILNDTQYRRVLQALDQRDGVDVLTTPEVTTKSGLQAQMQAVEIGGIVTGSGVGFGTGSRTATNGGASAPTFTASSVGPTLDVLPTVSGDEWSVHLVLVPSVTEFLGYDNPGQFIAQSTGPDGSPGISVLPLPHFRLRQISLNVDVWDSQTVVIGFPAVDVPAKEKDKPPVTKTLLVFVTPTIINPDGTRYHMEEEMSAIDTSVPPKK